MFGGTDLQIERANQLHAPPPKGQPFSVPLPGTATEGRTATYRHWKFTDKPLLEKLVPEVLFLFSCFTLADIMAVSVKQRLTCGTDQYTT